MSIPTLAQFTQDWLKERVSVTPQTLACYRGQIDHVLHHEIAALPINTIDDGHVARFLKDLEDGGLGAPQRGAVLIRLRSIFTVAQRRKLASDNPGKWVKMPRRPSPNPDPFTADEVKDVVRAAEGQERAIVIVLLGCGMRPNECFGLRWEDVDWRRGLLKIRRTGRRKRFGGHGDTKTPGSTREIPMDESVKAALQDQRSRALLSGGWIFSHGGKMVEMDGWRRRTWSRILRKAKVRERTLIQTRHSYAALRLEAGDNPNDIMTAMGHTSLKMLVTVYGKRSRSRKIAPSTVLDEILDSHIIPTPTDGTRRKGTPTDGIIGGLER